MMGQDEEVSIEALKNFRWPKFMKPIDWFVDLLGGDTKGYRWPMAVNIVRRVFLILLGLLSICMIVFWIAFYKIIGKVLTAHPEYMIDTGGMIAEVEINGVTQEIIGNTDMYYYWSGVFSQLQFYDGLIGLLMAVCFVYFIVRKIGERDVR